MKQTVQSVDNRGTFMSHQSNGGTDHPHSADNRDILRRQEHNLVQGPQHEHQPHEEVPQAILQGFENLQKLVIFLYK
jgi:hypothetical protein